MASGKSALLVRWARRVDARNPATHHVLFLPVSVRFGTNAPSVVFEALAACLAIIGDTRLPPPAGDYRFYQDQARGLLRDLAPVDNQPCLLIVDGLDEADGWGLGPEMLPAEMAPALRLVVAARPLPQDDGPDGWLGRLGWDQPQRSAQVLPVGPVDKADVREFVGALEPPLLPELCAPVASALTRQASGNTLLLRWLVQDLQAELASGRQPDLAALKARRPGLVAFVRGELMAHTRAANAAEEERRRKEADAALAVLAEARVSMPENDLWAVLERVLDETPPRKRLLDAVARFVARTCTGELGLEHELVGRLLVEELLSSSLITRAGNALLAWQIDSARSITEDSSSKPSPYVLAQYARNLARAARAQGPQVTVADWARLVSRRWVQAREASAGLAGVEEDARAVKQALHDASAQGERVALEVLLRAALVLASVRNRGATVSPALLALALQFELMAWNDAEAIAGAQPPHDRSWSFALLASLAKDAAVRERLVEESISAAREIARGKDTWRSCESTAKVLESILEPSQILELAETFKRVDIQFVPEGLAFLFARRVDPGELPRLAEVIGGRVRENSRHRFHLICAERLNGDLRQAALGAALAAARVKNDICSEADVLLVSAPEQARRRAQEWLAALGPVEAWRGPSVVSDLGRLFERDVLRPEEIEPVLQQIAERQDNEHFPWVSAKSFENHRAVLPTLDRLVRSTLRAAVNSQTPQSRFLARRVLAFFSGALTAEERAELATTVADESSDARAIQLARILVGTPPEEALMRAELTEAAKAAIPLVAPPSLQMKSLFELAAVSDSVLTRWCGERAFETAATNREAIGAFDSSDMLRFADIVEPAFVKAQLPKLLRMAKSEGADEPSLWRLRLGLASDDHRKRCSVALEAYAAARSAMPDVATATAILEDSIGLMPPGIRGQAYDEGLRWMREDEAMLDPSSVMALEKALRRARFTIRVLPPDEIQTSELWEVLAIYDGIAFQTEAAAAWKYAARLHEASKAHESWFYRFQPAYLNYVQSIAWVVEYTCAYWAVCARLAPSLQARLTFILGGWRHLSAERNPWDVTDDEWPRRERAIGLYAIAADSPPLLAGLLRHSARKVDPDLTLVDSLGRASITRFLMKFIEPPEPCRADGFNEAAKRAALIMTQQEQSKPAASLTWLLDDVSGFPRRDALDLLCNANRALIELIGADAASAALDDVVNLWP